MRWLKSLLGFGEKFYNGPIKWLEGRVKHLFGGDIHIGGYYEDNHELARLMRKWVDPTSVHHLTYEIVVNRRMYLNGDVVGLKEAPPHRVAELLLLRAQLKNIFRDHMIEDGGNHDTEFWRDALMIWSNRYLIIQSPSGRNYAMEHGHLLIDELKNDDYWRKYCDKPNGASDEKLAETFFLDKLDWFKTKRPLPKGFIKFASKRAAELSKHYGFIIHGMIFNHFHPEAHRCYYDTLEGFEYEHHINKAHCLDEVML